MPATRQTIMLSATIPEQVSAFAKVGLKDYVFVKLDSEYTIPDTMKLNFFLTKSNTKLSALLYFIKEKLNLEEKTIIFAATR
jgi:ATP-dependent RNA helicase DDX54/DBP10